MPLNAGEVAGLHCRAVLLVEIVARAHAVEMLVDVDAPLQFVEFAPGIGVDAGLVRAGPGDEIEDRGVVVFRSQYRVATL